jgi:hypothetical protein
MKRFFSKSSKNRQSSTPAVSAQNHVVDRTPTPQPKSTVSTAPHSRPHDHIAILPTQDGLLLRPYIARQGESDHYVRITWGKVPEIKQLHGPAPTAGVNWTLAVIVYGIIGIIDLFAGSLPTLPFRSLSQLREFLLRILSACYHLQAGGRTR